MDSVLYNEIISAYLKSESVMDVASALNVSSVKVRKVLITEGLWASKTSRQVEALLKAGLTTAQIAAQLCTTEKAVQQYLPYSRGLYGEKRTGDASRSLEYRQRIAVARERVIRRSKDWTRSPQKSENQRPERRETMEVIRLHMELLDEWNELNEDAGIGPGSTINRDILVPSDIQLWALHYVIQAAFGWQNSHLHNYELTQERFLEITEDKCGKWATLVGKLLRAPEGLEPDECHLWADDYEDGSFKMWLRKKYTGPYESHDIGEEEYCIRKTLASLLRQVDGIFKVQYRQNEDGVVFPADCIELNNDGKEERQLNFTWGNKDPIVETKNLSWSELPVCFLGCFFDTGYDYILERLSVADLLLTPSMDGRCTAEELIYKYDYGDNWTVSIKVGEANCADLMQDGCLTQEELEEARKKVEEKYRPVMVGAQGFNAIDDVGGMHGLGEFYRCVNGGECRGMYDDKTEAVAWAKSLGWTKRKISLKNRL